jgi:hypothetical protein
MTSLLGLLAEYGVWPRVANATAISSGIKVFVFHFIFLQIYTLNNLNIYTIFLCMQHLHDQLQWKTKACNDRIRELSSIVENQPGTDFISKDNHDPRNSKTQASYGSTVVSARSW